MKLAFLVARSEVKVSPLMSRCPFPLSFLCLPLVPHVLTVFPVLRQVTVPYRGAPGHLVLSRQPLVLAAGDGFTHSNVDGCLQSATGAARELSRHLATPAGQGL